MLSAPLGSELHQEPYHFYGGFTPYWYEKFLNVNEINVLEIESNMKFYSFFSQEFIRFIRRTVPWSSILNFVFLPFWLFILPFCLLLPLLSPILDKFDPRNDFTIGYLVIAIKK